MNPTISVALCTYNGERFVGQQVKSILDQEPPVHEVVVGDDGSTDATMTTLLAAVAGRGAARVRTLPAGRRLGPAANFSRTMAETTGDIVLLADQDDVWGPGRVACAVEQLQRDPGAHAVASDAALVASDGTPVGRSLFETMRVTPSELAALNGPEAMTVLVRRNFLPGMSLAVDRALLERCLPVPAPWMHDYWLVACAAGLGSLRVTADPTPLQYRQHDTNVLGAGPRTLRERVRRVVSSPNDPLVQAMMFARLARWMEQQPDVVAGAGDLVRRKSDVEMRRASFSARRAPRTLAALRLLRDGGYADFGSNGNWNVVRDLIHPPQSPRSHHDQ